MATAWRATAAIGGRVEATAFGVAPFNLATDLLGNVYLSESAAHRIERVDVSGVITVVAGTGSAGFSGDGGAATAAQLYQPGGLAVDGLGNLYIADAGNNRIRRVDADGIITTIAGTGEESFGGDGGLATAADLRGPSAVIVDGLGQLYIADQTNGRVRRVDTNGIITTIAGGGGDELTDGIAATSANLDIRAASPSTPPATSTSPKRTTSMSVASAPTACSRA